MNVRAACLLWSTCVLVSPASAQLRTALYGVEVQGELGASDVGLAIEAGIGGAGLTPAHDPLLDSAPADTILLQYASTRADALAMSVRLRVLSSGVAIEVAAAREVILRRYQLSDPADAGSAVRDVVRLTLDALLDVLANGAERAPGPPRVAIVIDDPAARAALEAPLTRTMAATAMVVPASITTAARAFLPLDGDPGSNTATLRQRLDADRVVLVVPGPTDTQIHVVDASGARTRAMAAGAGAAELEAIFAELGAPARREALRAEGHQTTGPGAPVAAIEEPTGAPPSEHVWLASTGTEYRFVRAGHLGFAGAISFSEGGGTSGGFSISESFPIYPIINTDTLALPINLTAQLIFLFGEAGGAFAGAVPAVIFGAGPGIQTRWFWAELHGGGGFISYVYGGGGRAYVRAVGVGSIGLRVGVPLLEHDIIEPHDLVSVFSGLDFLFGDNGWIGIVSAGISL